LRWAETLCAIVILLSLLKTARHAQQKNFAKQKRLRHSGLGPESRIVRNNGCHYRSGSPLSRGWHAVFDWWRNM